ncbi:MAG: hypothetical protein ACFE0Q_00275 [Anaerolineae bacterium]
MSARKLLEKIPFLGDMWIDYQRMKESENYLKALQEKRDPVNLEKISLPENEKIDLHCIWVSEVYTPSNINTLIRSLERLGWDYQDIFSGDTLSKRIQATRSKGQHYTWDNVGSIVPIESDLFTYLPDSKHFDLPDGVKYANLSFCTIHSSLTILTVQFVFQEEFKGALNTAFEKKYQTMTKVHRVGTKIQRISYIDVLRQSQDYVEQEINNIHSHLHSWISFTIPGYFSQSELKKLPTINFITSKLYEPSDDEVRDYNYLNILLGSRRNMWKNTEQKNVELRWNYSNPSDFISVFGNYRDLLIGSDQTDSEMYLVSEMNFLVSDKLVSFWAIHQLFVSYEFELSDIRDQATFQFSRTKKYIKNLNSIRQRFFSLSTDIQIICTDAENWLEYDFWYDTMNFRNSNFEKSFIDLLKQNNKSRIKHLKQLQPQIRDAILTNSNIISAETSLKLQRYAISLTILAVILTLISMREDIISLIKLVF